MKTSSHGTAASITFDAFIPANRTVELDHTHKPERGGDNSPTLMRRIAKGDEVALAHLIDRWQIPLFRFFDRSLGNHADAEDLTQFVFLRLHAAASRYRPEAKFSTYIFTIARRLLLDELKQRKRHPIEPTDSTELHVATPARDEIHEIKEDLEVCLSRLPENHRTALLLRTQRELSYKEIATIMKAREATVKTWIHRARQETRDALSDLRKSTS